MKKLVNNTTEQKIRRLVKEESINWLLNQFTCDEDDIFVSEALKELFENKGIEINAEALNYIVELYNSQLDKELFDADE